jgi:hypothetical protein
MSVEPPRDAASAAGSGGRSTGGTGTCAAPTDAVASLLSLPTPILESIAGTLYPDAAALVRLSAACHALRGLDNWQLWRSWVARRFGRDALPAEPLPGAPPLAQPMIPSCSGGRSLLGLL